MPQQGTQDVTKDPEFLRLPPEAKRDVLMRVDPEFAKLPDQARSDVISHLNAPDPGGLSGAWQGYKEQGGVTPKNLLSGLYNTVAHPIDTAKGVVQTSKGMQQRAREEAGKGNYMSAGTQAVGSLLPFVGKPIADTLTRLNDPDDPHSTAYEVGAAGAVGSQYGAMKGMGKVAGKVSDVVRDTVSPKAAPTAIDRVGLAEDLKGDLKNVHTQLRRTFQNQSGLKPGDKGFEKAFKEYLGPADNILRKGRNPATTVDSLTSATDASSVRALKDLVESQLGKSFTGLDKKLAAFVKDESAAAELESKVGKSTSTSGEKASMLERIKRYTVPEIAGMAGGAAAHSTGLPWWAGWAGGRGIAKALFSTGEKAAGKEAPAPPPKYYYMPGP